ncbi:MAG TPA: hypothetical protein VFA38_01055 [Nitrospirales bacterium]|nr:hypothetical protein [Nitrospirales bacterium]
MNNGSFLDAFPIEDFRIEVRETSDIIWRGQERSWVYTQANPPAELIACSNRSCYGGGVSIGDILRLMVDNGRAEYRVSEKCRGHKGSPQGRRQGPSCMHGFDVSVTLKYMAKAGAA